MSHRSFHTTMVMPLVLAGVFATAGSAAFAAGSCTAIKFAKGASQADITGIAPPDDVVCYSLATGAGQKASVRITGGRNIMFSIADMVDGQDNYTFATQKMTYRIMVGQLMRSVTNERFTMRVRVVSGQ